jgi:hypothetical protein
VIDAIPRGDALFDSTGAYRYRLSRVWDEALPRVCWILLNPSTATASVDDPTISRVVGFSRSWGFGSVDVVNLFAFRTPNPRGLRHIADPVGDGNDETIVATASSSPQVISAWGNHGILENPSTGAPRFLEVQRLLAEAGVHTACLGRTKHGQPRHPLYLTASTPVDEGPPQP